MSTAHQDFDGGVVELPFCLKLARLAEHERRIESARERGKPLVFTQTPLPRVSSHMGKAVPTHGTPQ